MDEIKLLQKLIQIPSLSGQEEKLAKFIADYCRDNYLPAKIQKGNVVIHLVGKNKGKALIFNAHMDTVSAGNKAKWKYPPVGKTAGKIVNEKIYGLGASDDKSAIASMLLLAKSIDISPCDIWFTFVCSEETDGSGAEQFLQWFKKTKYYPSYKQIAAIIGEPTDLINIEIGHRGNAFIKLTANGITGHGAKTYSGDELAVEKMLKALNKLKKTFIIWKRKFKHKVLGEPSLNITALNTSGVSVNKIPHKIMANLDIRTTPLLHSKLDFLVENTIGSYVDIFPLEKDIFPGLTGRNSMVVKICKKILPGSTLSVSLGSTDLSQFLKAKIDTIVLGPGDGDVIHKENEYIKISKVRQAVKIYDKIIRQYAGS